MGWFGVVLRKKRSLEEEVKNRARQVRLVDEELVYLL
jgi:heme exporter protein D